MQEKTGNKFDQKYNQMKNHIKSGIDGIGTAAVLASVLAWATGPIFIRYLKDYLDAPSQNLWRYACSVAFILPFLLWKIKSGKLNNKIWRLAIIPAIANAIMQSLFATSFYYLQPGFGSLLNRSSLIWIGLFSIIFFAQERPLAKSKIFWLGISMSILGICGITFAKGDVSTTTSLIGITLALTASAAWAVYIISVRIAFQDTNPATAFAIISLYTTVGLTPVAFIFGQPSQISKLSTWPLACVIISGIVCICWAHTFYYTAIRRIGTIIPELAILLQPFFVLVFSMVIFKEKLNFYQWTSGLILLVGSMLAILAQRHLKQTPEKIINIKNT